MLLAFLLSGEKQLLQSVKALLQILERKVYWKVKKLCRASNRQRKVLDGMTNFDIETYLMINEPAFTIGDVQYSVCCIDNIFGTWDSEGNTFDFPDLDSLLDHWIVNGKPFREVVESIM